MNMSYIYPGTVHFTVYVNPSVVYTLQYNLISGLKIITTPVVGVEINAVEVLEALSHNRAHQCNIIQQLTLINQPKSAENFSNKSTNRKKMFLYLKHKQLLSL